MIPMIDDKLACGLMINIDSQPSIEKMPKIDNEVTMLSNFVSPDAQFDINDDLIDIGDLPWEYNGLFDDVIVDGTRYGIITYEFPMFKSEPDFVLQFMSLSVLDESHFPEFDIRQTGKIVFRLSGYDTQEIDILQKAVNELVSKTFPTNTVTKDTALLAYE